MLDEQRAIVLFEGDIVCYLFGAEAQSMVFPWFVYPSTTAKQGIWSNGKYAHIPGIDKYFVDSTDFEFS